MASVFLWKVRKSFSLKNNRISLDTFFFFFFLKHRFFIYVIKANMLWLEILILVFARVNFCFLNMKILMSNCKPTTKSNCWCTSPCQELRKVRCPWWRLSYVVMVFGTEPWVRTGLCWLVVQVPPPHCSSCGWPMLRPTYCRRSSPPSRPPAPLQVYYCRQR